MSYTPQIRSPITKNINGKEEICCSRCGEFLAIPIKLLHLSIEDFPEIINCPYCRANLKLNKKYKHLILDMKDEKCYNNNVIKFYQDDDIIKVETNGRQIQSRRLSVIEVLEFLKENKIIKLEKEN